MRTRTTLTIVSLVTLSLGIALVPSVELVAIAFSPLYGFVPILDVVLVPVSVLVITVITLVILTVELIPDPMAILMAELMTLLGGIAPQSPTLAPRVPSCLRRIKDEQDARSIFGVLGEDEGIPGELRNLADLLGFGVGSVPATLGRCSKPALR